MQYEDQREFYSCPLCGTGMGNDIDNAIHGTPEHDCEVEKEYIRDNQNVIDNQTNENGDYPSKDTTNY